LISQAEALNGDKLLAWLDQAMDLDQYLRWIALMSLLQSGDFIDEVYFTSTEVTGPDAGARDYFSISAWDQDDTFSSCHKAGINAIQDPHGLLNCTEGRLDHAIFGEPKVYARFAEALEATLAWLDQPTFDAATHASEDSLLAVLTDDEARAAMVELLDENPDALDYEVAEEEVLARGAELRQKFAERRALLADLLKAYGG
jgi:heme-degrading monooxygenase HmoA